jgi:exosortase O
MAQISERLSVKENRDWLVNLLVVAAWLWLFRPIFPYLALIFTRTDFRTNQIVLITVIVLLVLQWRNGLLPIRFRQPLHINRPGLILLFGSAVGFLVIERFWDVNTVSATFFALGSYGLLSFWMQPHEWRRGLPAALLLVGALPFGQHMQTFVGYPMRIVTAALVGDGLAAVGVGSVTVETILVLENGVSHIDLPCSGVQSLWTGGLFLLAATWIERKSITWRWIGIAILFVILLFVANLLRVAALVVAGSVLGLPLLAEMVHVPLGVLGFVAACGAALFLLRRSSSRNGEQPIDSAETQPSPTATTTRNALLLAIAFVILSLFYVERLQTGLQGTPQTWQFAGVTTQPMPLNADEIAWLTKDGADSAERFSFSTDDLSGSILLISSRTWRAHHKPERCFEVYGLPLDNSQTHLVSTAFPLRVVSLGEGRYTASYWFQSAETTTDDYATRIWADLQAQRENWVLVSIAFDGDVAVNSAEVTQFYKTVHDTVAERMKDEG